MVVKMHAGKLKTEDSHKTLISLILPQKS